jgi:hypothetical protein
MAELIRVKARWANFVGGPGYSIFHFRTGEDGLGNADNAQAAADRVRGFFSTLATWIPNGATVTVESDVEGILQETGQLTNVYGVTAPAVVTGTASISNKYSAPTGAVVNWSTAGIRNGRRVRGRTFLVPMSSSAFGTDGTLDAGFISGMSPAATTLIGAFAGASMVVFGRPSAKGASDGVAFPVTSFRIPDMAAILTSRRD